MGKLGDVAHRSELFLFLFCGLDSECLQLRQIAMCRGFSERPDAPRSDRLAW